MFGIEQELASEGISYLGGTSPTDSTLSFTFDVSEFRKDPDVGAVLCGLDTAIIIRKCARHSGICMMIPTKNGSSS
jgi:4-nitrophenyl phosphatase